MPTTDSVHRQIEEATRQEELWDAGIATSLAHDRGISRKEGMLHYDGRVYVPRKASLRGEIISQSHDHITAGHPRNREDEGVNPLQILVAQTARRTSKPTSRAAKLANA